LQGETHVKKRKESGQILIHTHLALLGGRARHGRDNERLHARARVVGLLLAEARVHHVADAVDRQGRLGDVGRQHHLHARKERRQISAGSAYVCLRVCILPFVYFFYFYFMPRPRRRTFLEVGGAFSKILACCSEGSVA